MACRNEFKGIAAGIAGKFISRNNDVNGYWAMGLLYRASFEKKVTKISMNLLTGESSPNVTWVKHVTESFKEYLFKQCKKKGFENHQIVEAMVELEFNVSPTKRHRNYRYTWGDPFICRVSLIDDLMKKRTYAEFGWCGQHDPKKEHQSARQLPYNMSFHWTG